MSETTDVVIVGGGAAGLNGALMLARSRRSVVVIDSGEPRNAPADAVHGFFTRDGTPPAELLRIGRAEVRAYGAELVDGEVTGVRRDDDGRFEVALAGGGSLHARRLLVATGLVDRLPDVPGLAERWGRDVVHCPYCHGWEVRDRAIGVLATGPASMHHALLFHQLTSDLVFFAGGIELDAEHAAQLGALGIPVVDGRVTAVEVADDAIAGLRLEDGSVVAREVVAVATRLEARAGFLGGLGLHPEAHPSGMGEHIPSDETGRTSVDGVWVAGNVSDLMAQVGVAAAAGANAAARINADLAVEDAERALSAA